MAIINHNVINRAVDKEVIKFPSSFNRCVEMIHEKCVQMYYYLTAIRYAKLEPKYEVNYTALTVCI